MVGYRSPTWTLNNYTDEDLVRINTPHPKVRYLVYGKEIGEKKGTPHLQGYVEFFDQQSMSLCKSILGQKVHLEPRQGTPKQAAGYCKKGTDPKIPDHSLYFTRTFDDPCTWDGYEYGEISSQGKRTDVSAPVEAIVEGATMREVAQSFPDQFVKYHRGFKALRLTLMTPRNLTKAPEVHVLWGPTETGKTRDALLKYFPDTPHYIFRPGNGKWFDNYDGEMKIILDEFRGTYPFPDLLALLDRNECMVECKGSMAHIMADKFVITSPLPPWEWYPDLNRNDKYAQLQRRFTEVHHYGAGWENSVGV